MTKNQIQINLIAIHHKYSNSRKSTQESQLCTMWSTTNPPDEISDTPPLDAIEDFIDFYFEEDDAIKLYDMNIGEATDFIWKCINAKG